MLLSAFGTCASTRARAGSATAAAAATTATARDKSRTSARTLLRFRGRCGRPPRNLLERAQRTARRILARLQLQLLAARRHFLLERLVGQRDRLHQQDV